MDVLELAIPAVVVVSKLIGSEAGFGGTGGRLLKEGTAVGEKSVAAIPLIDGCSSLVSHRDATSILNSPESVYRGSDSTESLRYPNEAINFRYEDALDQLRYKITDSIQLQQKSGKVSRSVSVRSKRPRIVKNDDLSNQGGYNDANGVFESVGSYLTNCELPGKAQLVRQKSILNGKRNDRRNLKTSTISKYDAFSAKTGLASTSAPGGNTIFGLYGLKSDNPDVTKHLDELSLDELLDLSYKSPSSGKDKTKRPANENEKFLQTIKQACSVLELRKPGKSQVFSEVDGSSSRIMSPYSLSPASCVPNITSLDKEDINMTDASVQNKDFSNKPDTPPKKLDFSMLQPQDVFSRLALAPPKDLESLILDATKTGSISRNGFDSRLGKQTINKAGLPPFQWSHTYSGHLKTNLDATKLSSSRPTCQGIWHRIDDSCSLIGVVNASFKDLKSLTYDHSLVPFRELRSGVVRDETSLSPRTSLLQNDTADVFLWRNKKISGAVLGGATAVYVLFELLEYHLLTLVCHCLIAALALVFLWSNASTFINKSPPHIPEVHIPEDHFMQIVSGLRIELNRGFNALHNIAMGKDLKMFLAVVFGLWILSMLGSCCNFVTLFYIAFVLLHTIPVFYEKYEDQVDSFAEKALHEFNKQYAVFDAKVLSKIPKGPLKGKKLA